MPWRTAGESLFPGILSRKKFGKGDCDMRNLKKTLCLILALVFVLGLCTAGASDIEFKDAESIQYKEAVQTMAGLGILKGDDNDRDGKTEFRPKDSLTRAEAAKIISYVARGEEVEYWPSNQVFDDVPSSHWAAKYISYCSQMGIINGVGNNKFDPNGQVTLVAIIKMLLSACGYGSKKGEEFTGADWSFNVLKCAGNTPIMRGLNNVNLEGAASREETALLAYNTLMSVIRVALSSDTNSYVNQYINGSSNVTLAESVWGIRTDEGVVIANKYTSTTAKGTVLDGTGRIMAYYITEEDYNPDLLGHQIRITYRLETVSGADVATAYFIEDLCTEVNGADAARATDVERPYYFNSGIYDRYQTIPAREVRATAPGTFVLNADGKVIAYKTENYFISYLSTVNPYTQQAVFYDPIDKRTVTIALPAGAGAGDLVTVTHVGDIYNVKLCTRQNYVTIYSSSWNEADKIYYYSDGYNTFVPSKATNVWLPTNLTRLDGSYGQMRTQTSYTLWFDDQGGCIAFGNPSGSGSNISATSYCLFDAVYFKKVDTGWGEEGMTYEYYAQVILGDGNTALLPISKTTYDDLSSKGRRGYVYTLTTSQGQYILTDASTDMWSSEDYNTGDYYTDYSGASYIKYSGTQNNLKASLTTERPKAKSTVILFYTTERSGTLNIRKVKTVWFTTSASETPVSDTAKYVYIPYGTPTYVQNDYTYAGYLEGAYVNDLTTKTALSGAGFYTTTGKNSAGYYTLTPVEPGTGKKTGYRVFELSYNPDQNNYDTGITNDYLVWKDADKNTMSLSLAGVRIVNLTTTDSFGLPINSVSDVITALNYFDLTIALVEVVGKNAHTIGGSVIYVTNYTER